MPAVSVLIKPNSSLCNLNCEYCFYHDEANNRDNFDFGVMSTDTASLLIDRALDFADGQHVGFCFQGGEPTLIGLDFYKFFVKEAAARNKKGSPINYSLQTNGTNLDAEWCSFFKKNKFLVGVSLDGGSMQNGHRVDRDGRYVYERILRGISFLEESGVDFNVLSVVSAEVAEDIEDVYKWFKSRRLRYLQFIPCLKPLDGNARGDYYLDANGYAQFQSRLFKLYFEDLLRKDYVSIRQFDNLLRMALGERPEQCGMNGHCGLQFVVEANGNVYPCDFYCLDRYLLGNIFQESFARLANCETARAFLKTDLAEKCKKCEVFTLCRGGCKRYSADMDYCTSNKKFLTANLDKIMAAVAFLRLGSKGNRK